MTARDSTASSQSTDSIAVVVPSGNPAVEPEIHALVAPTLFPYVARFDPYPDADLETRLDRYVVGLPSALGRLRALNPRAVYVACTGSSYPLGPAGDRRWMADATASLGQPVVSAAGCVNAVLQRLGATRIRLVSPYPDWLTTRCRSFWQECGYEVAGVTAIDTTGTAHGIYDLGNQPVVEALEQTIGEADRESVVVVAGTGVSTLSALDQLAIEHDTVVVSSNLAAAWWLLDHLGRSGASSAALQRLTERTEQR